jgi:hypothetical protein
MWRMRSWKVLTDSTKTASTRWLTALAVERWEVKSGPRRAGKARLY